MNLKKWASARFFWIQVGKLYENRGPGKAGNQLDCVKGTRAFFGFDYINIDQITRDGKMEKLIQSHHFIYLRIMGLTTVSQNYWKQKYVIQKTK